MYNKRLSAAAACLIVTNVAILLAFESVQEFSWSRVKLYAIVSVSSIFVLWKVAMVIKSDMQGRCDDLERDVHGLSHDIRGPLQAALFASELLRKELEPYSFLSPSGTENMFQQQQQGSSAPVFKITDGNQERGSQSSMGLGESVFVEQLSLVDLIRANVIFASLMANNTLEKLCDTSKGEDSADSAFTIYEIVDTVISTIEGLHLDGENVETSFFSKTADARVICDLQQVQRLIMNLTINALKFSKGKAAEQGVATEGATPLAIHVSVNIVRSLETVRHMLAKDEKHRQHAAQKIVGIKRGNRTTNCGSAVSPYVNETYLAITVSDQGCGMSKQALSACVEDSPSRVSKRPGGGFGLGLYLTKKFCCDHMGGVAISSTPNVGSTVSAFFRVEVMEEGEEERKDSPTTPTSSELRRTVGLSARSKRSSRSEVILKPTSPGSFNGFSGTLSQTEEKLHSSLKQTDPQHISPGIRLAPIRKTPSSRDQIPQDDDGVPAFPAAQVVQGPRSRSGAGKKRRRTVVNLDLIICDDDVPSLRLSERILSDRISGVVYTFSRAESALECISRLFAAEKEVEQDGALVLNQRPLVLLTDVNFVGSRMQGVELIQKARMACPRLKIVVMSGDQSAELLQTMNEAGVDRVMYKPVTSSQVDSVFRSLFLAHPLRVKIKTFVE
jgi:signal transduction histidine kinase/CheY-like chemotaxis protein